MIDRSIDAYILEDARVRSEKQQENRLHARRNENFPLRGRWIDHAGTVYPESHEVDGGGGKAVQNLSK
jgi:hypothetical protein